MSIGTILDIITLSSLIEIAGLETIKATILGFIVGVTVNFNLHKKITFHDKSKHIKKQFLEFATVSILNFTITITLMTLLVEYIKLWYLPAKLITVTIVLIVSFTINSAWTFKKSPQSIK